MLLRRRRPSQDQAEVKHRARCSFCGNPQDRMRRLVAGPGVFICSECISLATEILRGDNRPAPA